MNPGRVISHSILFDSEGEPWLVAICPNGRAVLIDQDAKKVVDEIRVPTAAPASSLTVTNRRLELGLSA